MKITAQFRTRIIVCFGLLLLLTPIMVFAQNRVVVIPIFGDDAKPLKNIITVAKANGNFTDPVKAVNSIKDASDKNPYLVVIGPGVYTITESLVMQEYVDIAGSGENVTKIQGAISGSSDASSAIISGANNAALSSLTVENMGGSNNSRAIYNDYASPSLSNITVIASGGTFTTGILNDHSSPRMKHIIALASGGTYNHAVFNYYSSPTMIDLNATASGGTENQGVYNSFSSCNMIDVTASASGGDKSHGVHNHRSSPTMIRVTATASAGTRSYAVYNYYSDAIMTDFTATASDGEYNRAVYNENSSPIITELTASALGGINAYGVYNWPYSSPTIRRSTMKAPTGGLYMNDDTSAKVSQSTIIGGVSGPGTKTCVACDDGNGNALDANCE